MTNCPELANEGVLRETNGIAQEIPSPTDHCSGPYACPVFGPFGFPHLIAHMFVAISDSVRFNTGELGFQHEDYTVMALSVGGGASRHWRCLMRNTQSRDNDVVDESWAME